MRMLIGLEIYGAGNIGEDLQLAGFLESVAKLGFKNHSYVCSISFCLKSQKLRFPEIKWIGERNRHKLIDDCDIWLGVGDTPFQVTSGPAMLRFLKSEVDYCAEKGKPVLMFCSGAEEEARRKKAGFASIIKNIKVISARDEASANIIQNDFDCPNVDVKPFADLANISLKNIFSNINQSQRKYDLGWTVNTDSLKKSDVLAIKKFIRSLKSCSKVFICNEVRKLRSMERMVYKKYFNPWYNIFRGAKQDLSVPNYSGGTLENLVDVYSNCTRVITTRYHGLLIAAWAGCEVCAIARGSKVENLAKVLGVPYVKKPVDISSLKEAYASAVKVPRNKLEKLSLQAFEGVKYSFEKGL